ncbi:MAG: hypothetical protein LBK91_05870 [Synergistaceae bacterium]|jgi:hypothetical protein|nr:hypothetical protein [Synergistaceae bacterium]
MGSPRGFVRAGWLAAIAVTLEDGAFMNLKKLTCATLILLSIPLYAYACDDCEPSFVDAYEAYDVSQREDRDPVEGFWEARLTSRPSEDYAQNITLAIVKNTYGVYPDAGYIGVSTCDKPGCRKGEVKLLLKETDAPDVFAATFPLSDRETAAGIARLTRDEPRDRQNSILDMREVKYRGEYVTRWFIRHMDR